MTKKSFGKALKTSVTKQKESLDDRFATADSVLLSGEAPATRTAPPPATATPGRSQASASRRRPRAGKGTGESQPAAASEGVARDSFTCPQSEHAAIERARQKLARQGVISQKSEMVRVALQLLDALTPAELAAAYKGLAKIKPGRKTVPGRRQA